MRPSTWLTVATTLTLAGCAESRPLVERERCFAFTTEILPLLQTECGGCHGEARAERGFRVDSYQALMAVDANGLRRVAAGDAQSLLLRRARGEAPHPHQAPAALLAKLERWVVACETSYLDNDLVHPHGFSSPTAASFHGHGLRDAGWDYAACETCHGAADSLDGGGVGRGCRECHTADEGPKACDTCHSDEHSPSPWRALGGVYAPDAPGVGAHAVHVAGGAVLELPRACDDCHRVPQAWDDPDHIFDAQGRPDGDGRAEVTFGAIADWSIDGRESRRQGPASYDAASGTCSNVYCHGGALAEPTAPGWTDAPIVDPDCSVCHGLPPQAGTHAPGLSETDCATCHGLLVDVDLNLLDPTLHLDRAITLGDGSTSCSGCHGSDANPAPPRGVAGEVASSSPAVGAHQSHVGASTFTGPIACSACHRQPTGTSFVAAVGATGHIDTASPAEVFPAPFAGLGAADHAVPLYDGGAATCTNAYCHGGGELLLQDPAAGIRRTLSWTAVGGGLVACGSCHGVPMTIGPGHLPSYTINDCVTCHAAVVNGAGAIRFDAMGISRHINGRADFNQ